MKNINLKWKKYAGWDRQKIRHCRRKEQTTWEWYVPFQIRHRKEKAWKKMKKHQSPVGQCQRAFHMCNWSLRKEGDRKKIFEEKNGWNFSRFGENYKPTNTRNSMNPKWNKDKEKHTKTHHYQSCWKPVLKRKS